MRFPLDAFEVQENTELLRARRLHEMKHVDALPAEHLASPNVAIYELNHVLPRNATCDFSVSNSSSVFNAREAQNLSTTAKLATVGDFTPQRWFEGAAAPAVIRWGPGDACSQD